jgi:hypothetical protein
MKTMSSYYHQKEPILWIGEHAKALFKATNQSVLDKYENHLLLYDQDNTEHFQHATYLNERTNEDELDYDINALKEPVAKYLKKIKAHSKPGLLIGSPFELLMQCVIDSAHVPQVNVFNESAPMLFEKVYRSSPKNPHFLVDLTHQNVLFLKSDVPFRDLKKEAAETLKNAQQCLSSSMSADVTVTNLSEFLFRYQENQEDAVTATEGISFL